MPASFDHGMFAHTPAWHKMGNVLDHWPGTWTEAADAAGLNWDIETAPVFNRAGEERRGYYEVTRNDTGEILTISKDSRIAISNAEFGQIIEYIMGSDLGRQLKYETLISIKGGRIVGCTMHLDDPYEIPGDPSPFVRYICAWTNHDVGGLKCGPTDVRMVCANTQAAADRDMDRRGVSWTIRHTSTWADRVNEAREAVQAALRTSEEWILMAKDLAAANVSVADINRFIDKWLPLSTDMSTLQLDRRNADRDTFRTIYSESVTTDGIRGTKWGLLQTAIEMCDHYSRSHSLDTEIRRVLLDGDKRKDKAVAIVGKL
jgi:phage/plasmid-like protein (TIGR03299 family)